LSIQDQILILFEQSKYNEALIQCQDSLTQQPNDAHVLYLAGQSCRFLNDFDRAIKYLEKACELQNDIAPYYLALGIAQQLKGKLQLSIGTFAKAIEIDRDYELAYNSLAYTQKKMGAYELSLENYHAAILALVRRMVKRIKNAKTNPIYKHQDLPCILWVEFALSGAQYLCAISDDVKRLSWLSGDQAILEEETEEHLGLLWYDEKDNEGYLTRVFLPNYFNTFREVLKKNTTYSEIMGNRGLVLKLLNKENEAEQHLAEAEYFGQFT